MDSRNRMNGLASGLGSVAVAVALVAGVLAASSAAPAAGGGVGQGGGSITGRVMVTDAPEPRMVAVTTDQAVWGGLSGATPSEAVSWGKVNPGQLPDTVVAYCDSTIAFPLFCEYVVGSPRGRRPRKALFHRLDALLADLKRQAAAART